MAKAYQVKQVLRAIGRAPPERHRQLALEAAEAGVSLNRRASTKLGKP